MDACRREFLTAASLGVTEFALGAESPQTKPEPISAVEDLMREHAILERVLLIYETGVRRLHNPEADQPIAPEWFRTAAVLVRRVMEDYHQKLEERYVFPVMESHHRLTGLTRTLRDQHQAGRALTDTILLNAGDRQFPQSRARAQVATACEAYIRMFRPHMAWESTVLFPAFHELVDSKAADKLAEQFEDEEHRRFGDRGFERIVDEVADLEKQMGIDEMEWFSTPFAAGPRYVRR